VAFDTLARRYYIADEGNLRIRVVDTVANRISTLAGNGSPFIEGDGGNALSAMFTSITCVATDSNANLYIVDSSRHKLRRVTAATGIINTVAGTGTAGFSGDGGPATAATLNFPYTVVLDSNANIYIADELNSRVRRVAASNGFITTFAGDGTFQYTGDGVLATSTALNYPRGLAIDSASNLYIADTSNFRVRRVNPSTNIITTFLGAGYQDPVLAGASTMDTPLQTTAAIAMNATNNLYFTELETNRLWFVSTNLTVQPFSGFSTITYQGDAGPILSSFFNGVSGLATDASNNIIICDQSNYRIRKSYTFGTPVFSRYLTMNMSYSNYSTTTGQATVSLNGNVLKTFSASTGLPDSYSITDADITDYPLQSSNPATGGQEPYIAITQTDTAGYTQLQGNFWVGQIPNQANTGSYLNSNAGISMNFGYLQFPSSLRGVTIQNKYNDTSLRSLFYNGSLVNASDPYIKEGVESASLAACASTVAALPLHRFMYNAEYRSTFQTRDLHRLGFLTTEVAQHFPKSVSRCATGGPLSSFQTLDMGQIKYAHLGATKALLEAVRELEEQVEELERAKSSILATAAASATQRKALL